MIHKILYIGFHYEYAKNSNGLAINYKGWFQGFEALGYNIHGVFFDDFDGQKLQEEILKKAAELRPDMIFFILQKHQVAVSTLEQLQQEKYFTVAFFGDDQWRFDDWTSSYARFFSACLTTDKFSIRKYHEIGQNNVIYTQWASLSCNRPFENVSYRHNVSFIGGASRYRRWFVKYLEKRGIDIACYGDGWPNGRVTYEEMEDIFLSSKINLNISNSVSFDVRYICFSLKTLVSSIRLLTRVSTKNSSQTKARNFEIPVSGGFQLTDYVPTLDEYLEIGKEVVCYKSIDEVEKIIQYYLSNESERELIKMYGSVRSRSEHTFQARIVQFMGKIEKLLPPSH